MSQHERTGKSFKKKIISKDSQPNSGKSFYTKQTTSKYNEESSETSKTDIKIKQPTILLKTREHVDESSSSLKKTPKESESASSASSSINNEVVFPPVTQKKMTKSMKFLEDGILFTEHFQDHMQDNNNFFVVAIVGPPGTGKSTILNLLASENIDNPLVESIFKSDNDDFCINESLNNLSINSEENHGKIFKIQSNNDLENNRNCTNGIDMYISDNRVIYLDCQPFNEISLIDDLVENESKRSHLISESMPPENSGEIQSLQLTSFLLTISHVLIVVQDWGIDSNVCRFIQTAEMLKPTITSSEDECNEHFPHLLILQNKASVDDFSPLKFKSIQEIYSKIFKYSKLMTQTSLGIATGRLCNHLSPETCGNPFNIFLIPESKALGTRP